MFGFGRKKPFTRESFDEAAAIVEQRIADLDYPGARQTARALASSVEANNGTESIFWGEAKALQSRVALALGETDDAVEHLRAACQIEGGDEETRARLTHEMNLGDVLNELGRLEEAETVHRRGLEERRELFGEDDPEFGRGAESLGALLLRKGEYEEAARLGRQAVRAFRNGARHKLGGSLILWMLAEKARDPSADVLHRLDPDDLALFLEALPTAPGYLFVDAALDLRWEALEHVDAPDAREVGLGAISSYAEALDRPEDHRRATELQAAERQENDS